MYTLKEIKNILDSVNYGDKRDYRKIEVFCNGKYDGTTTWAKNLKIAKLRMRLQVGLLDACKITAQYADRA